MQNRVFIINKWEKELCFLSKRREGEGEKKEKGREKGGKRGVNKTIT